MLVVLTPTRNRRWTYEWSRTCLDAQTQQPDKWIVIDNSDDPERDWSVARNHPLVDYRHIPERKTIGALRNICLDVAREMGATILVFWDDDDYYPPTRIATGVRLLAEHPDKHIVGSSSMYILATQENILLRTRPHGETHATAGTWIFRASLLPSHRFDERKEKGEERTFTRDWSVPMVQMPSEEAIVVMGHCENTVSKSDVVRFPTKYGAMVLNGDNGKQWFRAHWPVEWGLFRSTFSV